MLHRKPCRSTSASFYYALFVGIRLCKSCKKIGCFAGCAFPFSIESSDPFRLLQKVFTVLFKTAVFCHKFFCQETWMPFIQATTGTFAAGGVFSINTASVMLSSVSIFHFNIIRSDSLLLPYKPNSFFSLPTVVPYIPKI